MNPNLKCGCAAHAAMRPVALAEALLAAQCGECGGMLMAMDDWRAWKAGDTHRAPHTVVDEVTEVIEVFDAAAVRHCPECDRLMQRLRVSAGPDFRIDRCVACQNLWFDKGEWQAIVSRGLAGRLDQLLSDGWQRRLQSEEVREVRIAALRRRYGDDCIDELDRIRAWLDTQPHRDELLALLRAD
uniref:zf-TFIIB domain-containing protein n=1 Tax=unclassified Variovorax TaxID=663243 RepID=UPI000D3CE468